MLYTTNIILLLIILFNSQAQEFEFKNFDTDNGLPSSQVFDICQDKKGCIWLASDLGVSRYDGSNFETFSTHQGLTGNSIIKIIKDKNEQLWFGAYDGGLSYFNGNEIVKYQLSDSLNKFRGYVCDLTIDTNKSIWLTMSEDNLIEISKNNEITIHEPFSSQHKESLLFLKQTDSSLIWKINKRIKKNATNTSIKTNNNNIYLTCKPPLRNTVGIKFKIITKNEFIISVGSKIVHIKNNKVIQEKDFENPIKDIFINNDTSLWISISGNGVFTFNKLNVNSISNILLKGKTINSIYKDYEGNLWFATATQGVYFISSLKFNIHKKFEGKTLKIKSFDILNNEICISTQKNKIFKGIIENNKILNLNLLTTSNRLAEGVYFDNNKSLWLLNSKQTKSQVIGGWQYTFHQSNNEIYIGGSFGYLLLKTHSSPFLSRNYGLEEKVYAICKDISGTLWIGTKKGLYSSADNVNHHYWGSDKRLAYRITDIQKIDSSVIVATQGNGLVIKPGKQQVQITTENGLSSNMISTLHIDSDTVIWVGTNKGLNKIKFNTDSNNYRISTYTTSDGLPSNQIKGIKTYGNYLWLGSPKGLITFNKKNMDTKPIPPKIEINHIAINNQDTVVKKEYTLSKKQNTITFFYKAITFKNKDNIKFKYKLEGFDKEWITTTDFSVRYPSLPYGNYTFYVTTCSNKSQWNSTPAEVKIHILKHFTDSLWFIQLAIMFIAIITCSIVIVIYRNRKNKETLKRQLLLSENKALRAQMNPHFIFNSMNSIQHFIIENNQEFSNLYLSQFSALIRMILENSKYLTIPLENEIRTLKYYLELEKLRFDNKFKYVFTIDPKINIKDIQIPPMLIQPLIENAIWHGIMPSKNPGILNITIKSVDKNYNLIEIEDNGIGRKKSEEINKKRVNHVSTGMNNILDRIELLNNLLKGNISLQVKDLEENNNTGTRIKLNIPIS